MRPWLWILLALLALGAVIGVVAGVTASQNHAPSACAHAQAINRTGITIVCR